MGIFGDIENKLVSGLKDVEQKVSGFAHSLGNAIESGVDEVKHVEHIVVSHIVHSPTESHVTKTTVGTPHYSVNPVTVNHTTVTTSPSPSVVVTHSYEPAMPFRTLGASHPELSEHHSIVHSVEHPVKHVEHVPENSESSEHSGRISKSNETKTSEQKPKPSGVLIVNKHETAGAIAHDLSQVIKDHEKITQQHKEYTHFVANLLRKAENNPFYREELKLVAPQIMQQPQSTMHGYVGNPFVIAKTLTQEQKRIAENEIKSKANNVLAEIQTAIHNVENSKSNEFMVNGKPMSKEQALAMLSQEKQRVENWKEKENERVNSRAKMEQKEMIENVANSIEHSNDEPATVVDVSSKKHTVLNDLFHNRVVAHLKKWNKELANTSVMRKLTGKSEALIKESKEYKKEHKGVEGKVVGDLGEILGYGGEFIGKHPLEAGGLAVLGAATGGLGVSIAGSLGEAVGIGETAGEGLFFAGNTALMGHSIMKAKNKEKAIGEMMAVGLPLIATGVVGGLGESVEPEMSIETNIEQNVESGEIGMSGEGSINLKKSKWFGLRKSEENIPIRFDMLGNAEDNRFSMVGIKSVGEEETPVRVSGSTTKLGQNIKMAVTKEGGSYEVPLDENSKMEIPTIEEHSEAGVKHTLTNVDVEEFEDNGLLSKRTSQSFLSRHDYDFHRAIFGDDQSLMPPIVEEGEENIDFTDFRGEGKGKYKYERRGNTLKGELKTKLKLSPSIEKEPTVDFNSELEPQTSSINEQLSQPLEPVKQVELPNNNAPSESSTSTAFSGNSGGSPPIQTELNPQQEVEELMSIHHAVPEALFREDVENILGDAFEGASIDTANVGRIATSGILALERHDLSDVLNGNVNSRAETISPRTITYSNMEPLSVQDVLQKPLLNIEPMEKVSVINPQVFLEGLVSGTQQTTNQQQTAKLDVLNALTLEEPLITGFDVPFEPIIEFERPKRIRFFHSSHTKGKGKGERRERLWKGKVVENKIADAEQFFGNMLYAKPKKEITKRKTEKILSRFSTFR